MTDAPDDALAYAEGAGPKLPAGGVYTDRWLVSVVVVPNVLADVAGYMLSSGGKPL